MGNSRPMILLVTYVGDVKEMLDPPYIKKDHINL